MAFHYYMANDITSLPPEIISMKRSHNICYRILEGIGINGSIGPKWVKMLFPGLFLAFWCVLYLWCNCKWEILARGTAAKTGKRTIFLLEDFINIIKISSHFDRRLQESSTHGRRVGFLGFLWIVSLLDKVERVVLG